MVRLVLIKVFYSLQNTITVVKCAIVASVSNIILNLFNWSSSAQRLAFMTSLSLVLILLRSLRGRSRHLSRPDGFFMKIFAASLFMCFSSIMKVFSSTMVF